MKFDENIIRSVRRNISTDEVARETLVGDASSKREAKLAKSAIEIDITTNKDNVCLSRPKSTRGKVAARQMTAKVL